MAGKFYWFSYPTAPRSRRHTEYLSGLDMHRMRDGSMMLALSEPLHHEGYRYGGEILNFEPLVTKPDAENCAANLGAEDMVVLPTRPPLDDDPTDKRSMKRSGTGLEVETAYTILQSRSGVKHGPHVFYNAATGDRFKDVKNGLQAAVERAGLSGITWHTFRHTFASRLTASGADLVTVKELLGHSTITVTMRYAHSNIDAKTRAVNGLKRCDKTVTVVPRKWKKSKNGL